MADVLFNITCTTCETRLNVRDPSLVGQIVNCPKCQGMVQITAPPGWQPPTESEPQKQPAPATRESTPSKPRSQSSGKPTEKPSRPEPPQGQAKSNRPKATSEQPSPQPPQAKPKKPAAKKVAATVSAVAAATAATAPGSEPPQVAPSPPEQAVPTEAAPPVDSPPVADTAPVQPPAEMAPLPETLPTASGTLWANPAEAAMRRWLWWGAVPVAALVILLGVWSLFSGGGPAPQPTDNSQIQIPGPSDNGLPQVPAPLAEFDDRWVPDSPQLVLSLDIAGTEAAGQLTPLLNTVPPLNQAIMGELFPGFGVNANAVEHLSWSSADLFDWSATGVVVITLAEGQSTASLRSAGTATEWQADGIEFRQLERPTWSRAFAVLDERTIVTGEEGLLRQLAERGEKAANLGRLEPLLTAAPADNDFFLALDLRVAHQAGWPMPTEWLDVWPQGRDAWRVIWNLPSALSFSFDRDDLALAELGLMCDGETVADKVRVALLQWIPQAKSVLSARIKDLSTSAQAADTPAASAYRLALSGASAALDSTHLEVAGRCVWLRADCGNNSSAWTTAAADSRAAMRADWYRAAGNLDETLQARLHGALIGYDQAEQKAAPGAINSGPLPPENVLSWLTAMLPYLGHEAWAEDLDSSYSWDSPKNRPVTLRALQAVQNPAVAQRETASGFPVTHYVGVAGIGPDAADLPRDDPRAGIFGYRGSRRLTDVPDGASNTIATAGVSERLGSWASGGTATVRGFTQQPYINGPDGFGSGQPGGMYVGMADGSSRFLSANIDPTVLEHLVTAAGGESVPLAKPPTEDAASVEPPPTPPSETVSPPAEPPTSPALVEPVGDAEPQNVIAVAERLQAPLPGIVMTNMPLFQAIRAMESYGSLLVTYDLDTMSVLGVPLDRPVSVRVLETNVQKALDTILASCGLKAVVRDNQLWVTGVGQASEALRTVQYAATDLTSAGPQSASELAAWIPRLIAPQTWQTSGGQGTVQVKNGVLQISQTDAVHLEIFVFCEKLRVARGLPPQSRRPAGQFPLTTRRARAAACLQQPLTINFFRPAALQRVLREVDEICDGQIAVNWLALSAEGKSPSLETPLSVSQVPLATALDQMLEPLGLDYRAIDERTVEVTTRAAADAHFEREFYPIRALLEAGETAPALIDRLRKQVGPGTWQSSGGRGTAQFDEPSRCLIVLQTQRGQVAVEQFLNALRPESPRE